MTVQTFGIPPEDERTDPVTGQPVASPNAALPTTQAQNSALPPSVQQQSSDTPVDGPQANAQGGGAEPSYRGPDPMKDSGKKPDTMIEDTIYNDPKGFDNAVQATLEAMQKQRKQAGDKTVQLQRELLNIQVLGESSGEKAHKEVLDPETGKIANGINAAEAAGKIDKEEAKQKRFALKNIYRIIKPEEMGLFLIDFGLRAMMAGESMGDLGALGAAGSGAMGALQERRRFDEEQRIAAEQRGIEAGERAAKDYETAAGIVQKNRELDIKEKESERLAGGYRGEKVYLENFFKEAGWSDQQIADFFGKAKGEAARRQDLMDALMARISGAGIIDKDPITGKPYREMGSEDIKTWVNRMLALESEMAAPKKGTDYIE
jgi:hypothetical protein